MQTLVRFWHWQRNERPSKEATQKMRAKHLSPLAEQALTLAAAQITRRHSTAGTEAQNDALRDLSLEFCRALEEMHATVPEGPSFPPVYAGRRPGKSYTTSHGNLLERLYAEGRAVSPLDRRRELLERVEAVCSRPSAYVDTLLSLRAARSDP